MMVPARVLRSPTRRTTCLPTAERLSWPSVSSSDATAFCVARRSKQRLRAGRPADQLPRRDQFSEMIAFRNDQEVRQAAFDVRLDDWPF
eukprot:1611868-Alexandrium_andersonii.AAC.1